MSKIDDLTVSVSIEGVFQKELMKVVKDLYKDHGIKIEDISFQWLDSSMMSEVISCRTTSSYSKYD